MACKDCIYVTKTQQGMYCVETATDVKPTDMCPFFTMIKRIKRGEN